MYFVWTIYHRYFASSASESANSASVPPYLPNTQTHKKKHTRLFFFFGGTWVKCTFSKLMAMSAALSLSQFPVSGYISFPKRRLPSRSFYIRAMSETSSSTSVSSQNEGPTTDYSSASSVTIAPPPNFKPPEPKRFAIRPDKIGDVLGAALPFLLRFATGVFVSG